MKKLDSRIKNRNFFLSSDCRSVGSHLWYRWDFPRWKNSHTNSRWEYIDRRSIPTMSLIVFSTRSVNFLIGSIQCRTHMEMMEKHGIDHEENKCTSIWGNNSWWNANKNTLIAIDSFNFSISRVCKVKMFKGGQTNSSIATNTKVLLDTRRLALVSV